MRSQTPRFIVPFALAVALAGCAKTPAPEPAAAPATADATPVAAKPKAAATPSASVLTDAKGIAAQGYDLVAYFDGAAAQGSADHTVEYQGATYQFATAAHKDAFVAKPAKYIPQFGGYCAFAVAAKKAKVPPNPETFRVQDGRLLLFFNGDFEGQPFDTSQEWDKKPADMLQTADEVWPSIKDQ